MALHQHLQGFLIDLCLFLTLEFSVVDELASSQQELSLLAYQIDSAFVSPGYIVSDYCLQVTSLQSCC